MMTPAITATEPQGDCRRPWPRRIVIRLIVFLSLASVLAIAYWASGLPLPWDEDWMAGYNRARSWTAEYDKASYYRITRAIAADPQRFCGRRLDDLSRELSLEDVPWDDGNLQNMPGSFRIYHFPGFALYVSLDWGRDGVTSDMLLERGSPSERLRGHDLLRIDVHQHPYVLIDGVHGREERMRRYWQLARESIERYRRWRGDRGGDVRLMDH